MIDCLLLELEERKGELDHQAVETIYFGGGTPSLLLPQDLQKIKDKIFQYYDVKNVSEVTLEANPDDMTFENLRYWKELGVNRLSVGIQSFREVDLKWMNRAHTAKESHACLQLAKDAGFHSFSVDLIYGLPQLSLVDWEEQITNVINYGVQHISAYCLTVEERTALAREVEKKTLLPADEDEQAEQFEVLLAVLKKTGYEPYEVSNFCLPGYEAQHNTAYWKGVPYLGIGPAAHSYDGHSRRFNVANNAIYMKNLQAGETYFEVENLTAEQRFNEIVLTGLRTKWGVSLDQLQDILPLTKEFQEKCATFQQKNWLQIDGNQMFLIGEGWLMADYISAELFVQA